MEFLAAYAVLKEGKIITRNTDKWKRKGLAVRDGVLYEVWDGGNTYTDISLPLEDISANDWTVKETEKASNEVILKNGKLTINGAEINEPYCMDVLPYEIMGVARVRISLVTNLEDVQEFFGNKEDKQ